jgi:hypothetical protein
MGKQNGHGTVTSPDGNYVREWKGNDFLGQGTMISTDGTKWVGEFRENKQIFDINLLSIKYQLIKILFTTFFCLLFGNLKREQ